MIALHRVALRRLLIIMPGLIGWFFMVMLRQQLIMFEG